MKNSKRALRTKHLLVRRALHNRKEKNKQILRKLNTIIDPKSHNILAYYPFKYEVDIVPFLKQEVTKRNILLSFLNKQEISTLPYDQLLNFSQERFEKDAVSYTGSVDMIIVPGVCFGRKGYRIGYGSGWYDQFLCNHKEATKLGLCFDENLEQALPTEPHDIPVDIIITPQEIVFCNN